ncbi:hypothetical protein BASA83_008197 [Batrachochytrium salamandrivorans]|nr:hypothetical protein BASA83_008197 [Batrachochytrium salamandrivorans]
MQFFTFFISAITVIALVHGAVIPIMDTPASSQEALETRSYNDPDSGSNLEKRSPRYGRSNFVPSNQRCSRSASPFKTPPRSQVYTFSTSGSSARRTEQ